MKVILLTNKLEDTSPLFRIIMSCLELLNQKVTSRCRDTALVTPLLKWLENNKNICPNSRELMITLILK
jgi:hypothetical protein